METLLQPYAPDIMSDQGYTAEENPEAMFDMLTIQTLRERYQGAEQVEMTDGRPLINDQEFEIFVREFPIDDSISECFSSPDNPVRKSAALPTPKSNNSTPVKQNKLKKKLQQRTVQEDNVLSDEDTKSSDSKRSKLTGISSLFGKKNKNKEGYRPLESGEERESPDITNAIINACANITNDYTSNGSKRNAQDSVSKGETSSRTRRETKASGRRKDGSVILEEDKDKETRKGSIENGLTDLLTVRGLPPVPSTSSAKLNDRDLYNHDRDTSDLDNFRSGVSKKESPVVRRKQTTSKSGTNPDPEVEEIERLLALTDDAMIGQTECVRCFMEQMSLHGTVEQTLMSELFAMAVQYNKADSLAEIIPYYDADPPSQLPRDQHGDTAAHLAAKEGKLECLQVLLENGFDVLKANNDGQTVLQTALNYRQQTVYKYLILYQTCQCLLQQTTLSRQLHQRYEMSEDEESIIQSLKSEEEDDASLVCHI
ncbi:hypothetical protein FSP39_022143 [Pinctada imbricata]|uniref:Uncharacterized protein n=1 Tax=Pinctada imbricata TaxID=66713 RepID=A0AA89C5T1_PINIB|nr:hypothetical protein FSP39_022143 [Pinctada imbricata]